MNWLSLEQLSLCMPRAAKEWRSAVGDRYPDARFMVYRQGSSVEAAVGRRSCNWWPEWGWNGMTGRTWNLWAHRYESGEFCHIGERWWVKLFDPLNSLVPVRVEEIIGDMFAPEVTHYGWMEPGDVRPAMVHVRCGGDPRLALLFLNMCFPYGVDAAVKDGQGVIVALRITERAP